MNNQLLNPLKSILLEGALSVGEIVHKLCPEYFQIQSGIWQVAVHSVSINHSLQRDYIFNITSTLVFGDKNHMGKLKRFQVVLNQFKINKNIGLEVIYNQNPSWFLINNTASEYFSVFINEWPTVVKPDPQKLMGAIVGVTLMFRRLV